MCEHLHFPDGTIVCGLPKRKFCACGRPADYLCDWKVAAKESGTCDRPICAAHAKQVAPGKHLCPEHRGRWDEWQRKHPPAQASLFEENAA